VADETRPEPLASPVWNCRVGPRYDAGHLTLADGRLRFETATGAMFDAPLDQFERLDFAWGGSELKVKVGEKKFKLVFSRPKGAPIAFGPAGAGAVVGGAAAAVDLAAAAQAVGTLRDSAHITKVWREAIEAQRTVTR
jgi:hypothetical protein